MIGSEDLHDLAAAYALDALDETERLEFEDHLEHCSVCAREIDSLRSTATELAYAAEGPAPPEELRSRLLERARAERPASVVSLRKRRIGLPAVAAVAAIAACAAIGFGVWAASLSSDLDAEQSAQAQVSRVLSSPNARRVELSGQPGELVVSPSGNAVLIVSDLSRAPDGKTYEAWVIGAGANPLPAGLFAGGRENAVLLLERAVPKGTKVAVTLEPAGGVKQPTGQPLFGTQSTV